MFDPVEESDHLRRNVELWSALGDEQQTAGRQGWEASEPRWGVFEIAESAVGLLPPNLDALDVIELGCGTGYVSSWIARLGGLPVGLDPTPGQLSIAAQLQAEFKLTFPLVRAAAEDLPFADHSFDLAISEYGAAIWADPYRWVPEAARVLRPGGELVFLGNSTLLMLCAPDEEGSPARDRLLRPQFGMCRFVWPDTTSVDFHLSHGDWIRLLRSNGLEVEDLIELRPPEGATTRYDFVTADWAGRWPCEEAWRARLRG
jgi:SAM-dependent methyltransferase